MKKVIKMNIQKAFLTMLIALMSFNNNYAQIQNGSYETAAAYPAANGFLAVGIGSNNINNWLITGNTIDMHHSGHLNMQCPAGGGTYHIDLNQSGAITQQNIPLVAAHIYRLTFWSKIHANMDLAGSNAHARINIGVGVPANNLLSSTLISKTNLDVNWMQTTIDFTAINTGNFNLSFIGNGSSYQLGGVLIDLVSISDLTPPSCEEGCYWKLTGNTVQTYINGTHNKLGTINNQPVRLITNNLERGIMTHSGLFGFGTINPTWNFRTTIDNRDLNSVTPNSRNGLHVIAIQPPGCNFGNGVRVQTSSIAATKAISVDGNGTDRAIVFGNGMSWFKNRMQIGGISPTFQVCDDNSTGHALIINGTGIINGLLISSDRRFKNNIKTIENASDIINKMNPVIYDLDTKKFAERNFDSKPNYGFIAQELMEIVPNIVNVENDNYLSVNYIQIIPILTQAIKEQQVQIEKLKALIATISETKSPNTTQEVETISASEGVVLSQNVPNPFSSDTRISYTINQQFKVAKLGVYDLNGQELKLVSLNAQSGDVIIQGGNLKPGMYLYTLIVDGKSVATKRMTLTSN